MRINQLNKRYLRENKRFLYVHSRITKMGMPDFTNTLHFQVWHLKRLVSVLFRAVIRNPFGRLVKFK